MQFTAAQIAMMINGKVEGNADAAVGSFGKIEEAQAGQLSFLANPKYEEYLYSTRASIIIINEAQELKQPIGATLIRVPDAYSAFATLLDKYQQIQRQQLSGIQQPVYIAATAKTGDNVFIGAFAYLGENVILGNGVKVYPHVFLGDNVIVGDHT
ncbi:MAG TPA: LpxD N-terminal domain-containing protein, partial [Ferruginibacter sp.]|nr:LpxD N-terminal domain-containing protein [Ferruginibacter sp.]